jgi:hypothetical protein
MTGIDQRLAAWLADEMRSRTATDDELADVAGLASAAAGGCGRARRHTAASHLASAQSRADIPQGPALAHYLLSGRRE